MYVCMLTDYCEVKRYCDRVVAIATEKIDKLRTYMEMTIVPLLSDDTNRMVARQYLLQCVFTWKDSLRPYF